MAPGVGDLPAALGERDPDDGRERVDVVAALERYLASAPHRTVRRIGLALGTLEWLPFPWRFSRASLEARQELLGDLEGSGASLVRDLLLFMKVLTGVAYGNDRRVRLAVGYEARCGLAEDDGLTAAPATAP